MYQNEILHSSSVTILKSTNNQLILISVRPAPKATIYENTNFYFMTKYGI